jgi:hypothetical protein
MPGNWKRYPHVPSNSAEDNKEGRNDEEEDLVMMEKKRNK